MILKNGMIYDSVHPEPYQGDVAIRDGRIAAVGGEVAALPGEEILDVSGKRVYPGLVEAHWTTTAWGLRAMTTMK